MQDCKLNSRFKREPDLLQGKWALYIHRADSQRTSQETTIVPYEVVHVNRREVTLVESWSRIALSDQVAPKIIVTSLTAFLDPYSAFSYLGPGRKFAWMREPGALAMSISGYNRAHRYGSVEITGTRVTINHVPRMFRTHVERLRQESNPPLPPRLFYQNRFWEAARMFKPVLRMRNRALNDWEDFFREANPTLVPTEEEDTPVSATPPPEPPKPEPSVKGPSHWDRIRTRPELDDDP